MACGSCGRQLAAKSGNRFFRNTVVQGDCSYNLDLMQIWLERLMCIKNNYLFEEVGYSKYKINVAIGTVQSAINTQNVCMFAKQLDEVNDIILALINTGKCQ